MLLAYYSTSGTNKDNNNSNNPCLYKIIIIVIIPVCMLLAYYSTSGTNKDNNNSNNHTRSCTLSSAAGHIVLESLLFVTILSTLWPPAYFSRDLSLLLDQLVSVRRVYIAAVASIHASISVSGAHLERRHNVGRQCRHP